MLWFSESFFPVLWIVFLIYWQSKPLVRKPLDGSSRPLRASCGPREHLGSNGSSPLTMKQSHELITTRSYAVVRHPIYTGILSGLLGAAIADSQVRGFIGFVLVFLILWVKLRIEERWMHSQFGENYATYGHQTRL